MYVIQTRLTTKYAEIPFFFFFLLGLMKLITFALLGVHAPEPQDEARIKVVIGD